MAVFLLIVQVLASVALIAIILIQPKGTGLGSAFGGGQAYRSKRGLDRLISKLTFVIVGVFLLTSIARMFLG